MDATTLAARATILIAGLLNITPVKAHTLPDDGQSS